MPLELLSRIQFAFTISFHILFPAFSIGLITYIAFFETLWIKTQNAYYRDICIFWSKVLALTFGMGIVSGIVMEFQLGTNWAGFTKSSGDVLGVLFTYEVLTAFFIEAGFLGVMFFGWKRVSPQLHYIATLLTLFGVTLSAFWILSANSWMQYPTGVNFSDGKFSIASWHDAIFNPTFIPRFLHMLVATYIASSFVVIAICSYYLITKQHINFAKTCIKVSMIAVAILMPIQILIGDKVGLNVHQYQPIKTAAIEAVWETQKGAPLVLFGWPDAKQQKNLYAITIPKGASIINTHQIDGELIGLKTVPADDHPYVPLVFFSFRIMVGLGILMLFIALTGAFLLYRDKLYTSNWFLKCCIPAAPLGFFSIITGWFTAEFGRQPWVIYQYVRTAAAHSHLQIYQMAISLGLIVVVYGIIFGFFYFKYLFSIIRKGPAVAEVASDTTFAYLNPTPDQDKE